MCLNSEFEGKQEILIKHQLCPLKTMQQLRETNSPRGSYSPVEALSSDSDDFNRAVKQTPRQRKASKRFRMGKTRNTTFGQIRLPTDQKLKILQLFKENR